MSQRNYPNRSYVFWSDAPQERWRGEDREKSLIDPRCNQSLNNTNDMQEYEEVTDKLQ